MISIGTFEQLQQRDHTLALYCVSCDRWGEADLNWLIKTGKGDKPVIEARFKCQDCGENVEKQVRPPVPTLGGAVAYI
jgi:transposase-like protein